MKRRDTSLLKVYPYDAVMNFIDTTVRKGLNSLKAIDLGLALEPAENYYVPH